MFNYHRFITFYQGLHVYNVSVGDKQVKGGLCKIYKFYFHTIQKKTKINKTYFDKIAKIGKDQTPQVANFCNKYKTAPLNNYLTEFKLRLLFGQIVKV